MRPSTLSAIFISSNYCLFNSYKTASSSFSAWASPTTSSIYGDCNLSSPYNGIYESGGDIDGVLVIMAAVNLIGPDDGIANGLEDDAGF